MKKVQIVFLRQFLIVPNHLFCDQTQFYLSANNVTNILFLKLRMYFIMHVLCSLFFLLIIILNIF